MDEARRRLRSACVRPWFLWLTDAVPGSPLWVGAAVSAALMGVLFALPSYPAPPELSQLLGLQIMTSFVLLTGIFVAAMPWMERAALRDLAALQPSVRRSEAQFQELEHSVAFFPVRHLWFATFLGLAIHLLISASVSGFSRVPSLTPYRIFPVIFWVIAAPATYVLLSQALLFRRIGRELSDIHLFDVRPLKPFSRAGLRTALFYSASLAIVLVGHTDVRPGAVWIPTYAIWAAFLLWTPAGLALALLPVWGVHRRVQAEKAAELDRIRAAMDGVPNALEASSMAAHAKELRGIALLDYRERVEAVREWPFDASGLRRLALYLLIPPLGWLGGALVERGIDRALQ